MRDHEGMEVQARQWPVEAANPILQPQFAVPRAQAPPSGLSERTAAMLCRRVTVDAVHRDCMFDVATTGDESFAVTVATVLRLARSDGGGAVPIGSVTSIVNGSQRGSPCVGARGGDLRSDHDGHDHGGHHQAGHDGSRRRG
ncbi:MAG: hypothetical protein ACRD12_16660 [Acidimicrobiales bacterium]